MVNPVPVPSRDSVDKFRSYLLHGNKVEGLEFAMKGGLGCTGWWGILLAVISAQVRLCVSIWALAFTGSRPICALQAGGGGH